MDGTTKQNIADGNGDISEAWPTFSSTAPSFYILDTYCYGLADTKEENISGSVTAVFTWAPDNANDVSVPPQNLYVEEDSNANAFDQYLIFDQDGNDYDLGILPNVNDGLDDASIPMIIDPTWHNPADSYGYAVSSGSHVRMYPTNGQTVVKLPKRTLKADVKVAKNDLIVNDWSYLEDEFQCAELDAQVTYNAQEDTNLPKSVMIGGGSQTYDGSQWTGTGDTLYNNYEGDPMNPFAGRNYGQLSWSPSLIGGPWPAFADWQAGWFTRDWHWFSDGQSASGSDFTSPPFATDRPHVDWPWDSDGQYIPRDFLEECKNAPASQSKHIFLHLTDSDQLGTHPEWSFDKTANYYVTYHPQHELVEEQATQEVPTSENPWKIIVLRGGTNVQASGPFTSWQPTIYFEANQDFGISFNGAAWILDSGVSFSTGTNQGYNLSVNPQPIPASQHGAVYWHRSIIRHPFTYNQYTVDGLEYESYDANGVGQPFHGHVDRSRGWPNAPNDMDAKIVLSDSDRGFPETIDHD